MKKAILMVLFFVIALLLFGCQSKNGISKNSVIESIKVSKVKTMRFDRNFKEGLTF